MFRPGLARRSAVLVGLLTGCPDGTKSTVDADADGFDEDVDCDDADDAVYPGAIDDCDDGVDSNCDGVDPVCSNDADGDGYDAADECDDTNPDVYPGAFERCTDGVDNDCDGISTECLSPTMIYEANTFGLADPYGTAVFADRIVFGDPTVGSALNVTDGRVVGFALEEGTVSELDAAFVSSGEAGGVGAYGIVTTPWDDTLCLSADYDDNGLATDAGRSWCFTEGTVAAAAGSLALGSAQFTVAGNASLAFARVMGEQDVDGDGLADLVVYSADGLYVIYGSGAPWAGDYVVPTDADLTIGSCASDPGYWCGFASAIGPGVLAASGPGGPADEVSFYQIPITSFPPVPDATYVMDRAIDDSMTSVALINGFAIGSSSTGTVHLVDFGGNLIEIISGDASELFGYSVATFIDDDGHELLLVGARAYEFDGSATGGVYVFDLTANGLPTSTTQARFILIAPTGYENCGLRTAGGVVSDDFTVSSVATSSCYGHGGLTYVLDENVLPPPAIPLAHIQQTGPNAYSIKRSAIDIYGSNAAWAQSLAQTEQVTQGGQIVGWRLHAIATGSPLFRAGLRSGDIIRRVNDIAVTTPAVVRQLAMNLLDDPSATVRIQRNGVQRTITYTVVP